MTENIKVRGLPGNSGGYEVTRKIDLSSTPSILQQVKDSKQTGVVGGKGKKNDCFKLE